MHWWRFILMIFFTLTVACCLLMELASTAGNLIDQSMIVYRGRGSGFSDIFLLDVKRNFSVNISRHFLKHHTIVNDEVIWSPDGQYIAFFAQDNITSQRFLEVLSPVTGEVITKTSINDYSMLISWQPENTSRIVFNVMEESWNIYIMTLNTKPKPFLNDKSINEIQPRWSPDGKWLAYLSDQDSMGGGYNLFIVDSQGENVKQLTTTSDILEEYDWSPDSIALAFYRSFKEQQSDIYTVQINTGAIMNLTQHESINGYPLWSPNGSQIAFLSNRDTIFGKLYLMNTDGSGLQVMTHQEVLTPAWSPDGRQIIYTAMGELTTEIYVLDVYTLISRRLTYTYWNEQHPVWRP